MRNFPYAFAVAAVCGLASLAPSAAAAPAAGALARGGAVPLADGDGPVHEVHGWHCARKMGRYGQRTRLHFHPEACRDGRNGVDFQFGPSYDRRDNYLYDYSYSYSPRRRLYNRYRRPLAGRDLHLYYRLKLGPYGWGR